MAVPIQQSDRKFTALSARKNNPLKESCYVSEIFSDIREDINFYLIIQK